MEKYKHALNRNLNEVRNAWFEWRTLLAIESVHYPFPELSFFYITHSALFNCAMGHLMKVLDANKDSASFWFIYEKNKTRSMLNRVVKNELRDLKIFPVAIN